jgi:tripartite-type tricarboxylate transporter receptor subunit TctC
MFDNLASALPNIRTAKVRALAVTTLRRSSFLPELPTLDESGLKGFAMTTWWGVMAPARTPTAVIERLNAEILKAIDSGDTREKLRAMGSETPTIRTPEQFSAFVASELKAYSELVKRSGAKPD